MKEIKKDVVNLSIALIGVFLAFFLIVLFNKNILYTFPVSIKSVIVFPLYWTILLIPLYLMKRSKEKMKALGFTSHKLVAQITIGILIGISMSAVLTLFPISLGLKDMVGSSTYTKIYQFIYAFIYQILAVAFTEEFVFRGYIFKEALSIKNDKKFAIIISSLAFGICHIFVGGIIQAVATTMIGGLFCLFREKIGNCTLLSLIIGHGIYNGLIIMWVSLL